MERTNRSICIDNQPSVINKISNSDGIVTNSLNLLELERMPQKRHVITNVNGFGVCKLQPLKQEKKNETLTASKKSRKIYVLPEHVEVISKDPPLFKCSICKRSFKNKLHGKYHEPCLTGNRPLVCEVCDKGFITKSHFEFHLRSHSDIKPYECNRCCKRFTQKDKLKRHIQSTHLKERPYACKKCPKRYASKQGLDVHIRGHLHQRPFQCDLCLRSFSSKLVLQRHCLTHYNIRNFKCEICDKKFTHKCELNVHLRAHSGIRPYKCNFVGCTKSFTMKNILNRHLQSHSDIHDYECSICVTPFRRKDNLERHMRNFHPETMVDGHLQQIVSIVQPESSALKKNIGENDTARVKGSVKCNSNIFLTGGNISSDNHRFSDDAPQLVRDQQQRSLPDNNFNSVNNVGNLLETNSSFESRTFPSVIVDAANISKEVPRIESSKSEEVSVINRSSNNLREFRKHKANNIECKKPETIVPFRTITPSPKLSDTDKGNCVPTITKVTYIVHTTKTGIPKIQTVITTKDDTKNITKQSKDSNSDSRKTAGEKCDTAEKDKRCESVIRFASRKVENTRKECYRKILRPSSDYVTKQQSLKWFSFPKV